MTTDWEYTCRVASDGRSEVLTCEPTFPPPQQVACVAPNTQAVVECRADMNGHVIFGFGGDTIPSLQAIERRMSGFDRWAIFTAQQPPVELLDPQWPPSRTSLETASYDGSAELLSSGGWSVGAGSGLVMNAHWPFFYRALQAGTDPTLARILAGESLFPRAPSGDFVAAASRAEMTFRHLRPGGNATIIGTNRISVGRNIEAVYEIAIQNGRDVVRIHPGAAAAEDVAFLRPEDLLEDLDQMERQMRRELSDLAAQGTSSRTKTAAIQNRLNALQRARDYVSRYREFHVVERVPSNAMTAAAADAATENAMRIGATHGMRVVGGVLIVYGVYSSVQRVREAPPPQRNRVATREVGGWAGGMAGAWAVGEMFAIGGAALGVETGPGLIVTGLIGGLVGGIFGGIGGALGADWVYSYIDENSDREACALAHGCDPTTIPYRR